MTGIIENRVQSQGRIMARVQEKYESTTMIYVGCCDA